MDASQLMEKTNKKKNSSLRLMFKWMGKHWYLLIISFGLLYVISYARTLIPLFTQHIIDYVLDYSNNGSTLPNYLYVLVEAPDTKTQLILAALMIIAVDLVRSIAIFFRRVSSAYFGERVAFNLRNNLYRKLQNMGYSFHTHSETGDLIQRCTSDVETYKFFVADQIIEVARLVLLVGLSIWQMSKLNVDLMFITLTASPILLGIAIAYFKKVEKMFTVIEENESNMTTDVQENVSGSRVVKAFANEKYEVEKFEVLNRKFTDSDIRLTIKMASFWSGTDIICFAQFCIISVVGVIYAAKGIITLGVFTAFLAYAGNIIWPMRHLGRLVGDFSKATVAITRLDAILSQDDEYAHESASTTPKITGEVVFEHVSFQFPGSTYHQLNDINFHVKPGETIAIVGKTGSGKSTLMNLLVRLLDTETGAIYFDGIEIKNIEKHHLRNNVGIILQEPFLFSKTVEENIKIADRNLDQERVKSVAKIARIHEDIVGFEKGYETLVGERGVTLSGGQKQRVAIARMLLKPKPILIFDDSLSAVDTETDLEIRGALKKEWKQSTVFIITHRITTAQEANRIFVLDKGVIAEVGTHAELLKKGGIYQQIWEIQSKIDFQIEGGEQDE
ncbi:MAG: ABC transporter ATP-binding protein [Candidatus Izemoplasmatales bacterium]|jgi:ATP-binding cassette subfamily B protein|nr:ABC transporter ATP-binding protein [Candidatus Izemoplasmatales bacterium]MDD3865394.1 ABC transporter ATP-binding protein [Candidatus Izemoplasmatales bacterium]